MCEYSKRARILLWFVVSNDIKVIEEWRNEGTILLSLI